MSVESAASVRAAGDASPPTASAADRRNWPPPLYWFWLLGLLALNAWASSTYWIESLGLSDGAERTVSRILYMVAAFIVSFPLLVGLAKLTRAAPAKRRILLAVLSPIWLGLIGLVAWTRLPASDHAVAHIVVMISTFVALMTLLVWLAFFSGLRPVVARAPLLVALVAIGLTAACFRIDYVTSELWPVLALRWSTPPDKLLEKLTPATHVAKVPLDVVTENDFPQFLGPTRTAGIDRLALARDWGKQPPELIWKHSIGAGHSGFAVVNGFAVTMEQRGDDELVTCYDALTGELKWSHSIQARHSSPLGGIGPRSTPTIHEGKVYALGATGVLRCLDGTDGTPVWSRDLLAETGTTVADDLKIVAWGRAASPLIVDQMVIVPGGGPKNSAVTLLAFDARTGKPVWAAAETSKSATARRRWPCSTACGKS